MEATAYFRAVVQVKRPDIQEAWILRVVAKPLEERQQADGRFALWGSVPEAQNRVLRVITLGDRRTVHNAFFDRGFHRRRLVLPGDPDPLGPAVP